MPISKFRKKRIARMFTDTQSIAFLVATLVLSLQGCSVKRLESDLRKEKEHLISQTSVFGERYIKSQTQDLTEKTPGDFFDAVETVIPVVDGQFGAEIDILAYCSTNNHAGKKRLIHFKEAYVQVKDSKGHVVCQDSQDQLKRILDEKKVRISKNCLSQLTSGQHYRLDIVHGSETAVQTEDFSFVASQPQSFDKKISVLYDDNPNRTETVKHSKCDQKASPLIALLGTESETIDLTAPTDGLFFDILGRNATPRPHTKKKISWFSKINHSYYFITLPNAEGKVQGINELFGDNTLGPDGKFAENGYAALAKFDSDRDQFITAQDPIYAKIRLWNDANLNGQSEDSELYSLVEKQIEKIDLRYDQSYRETDAFGNETLMKSSLIDFSGQQHLLFDLWFRHLNLSQ